MLMRTILLIDDERAALDMLGLFLEAYGYIVLTAENGESGLELFQAERPEIVMTDIAMPEMDGFEVLRRIKNINADTEVIVFTGHGDLDLAVKALNLNATDFIHKPIQKKFLEAALKRAEERLSSWPQENCNVRYAKEGDVMVVELRGNVTSQSEKPLSLAVQRINQKEARKVLFCLDENAAINGAGLALLSQLLQEGAEKGQRMLLTGVTQNFKRVFEMIGITHFAKIAPDKETALAQFASMGVEEQ